MDEMVDVYDENKNKTGKTIARKNINMLNKGEYMISVHCFIINSLGNVLLTQRGYHQTHGGKWECTGGGVKCGESSVQAIQRELEEEIGIHIRKKELILYNSIKVENQAGNIIRDIYVVYKDIALEDIDFCDGEEIDCKYVTKEELKQMVENKETKFENLIGTPFYHEKGNFNNEN